MSVGDLTVFVTETTIFVKCHANQLCGAGIAPVLSR